MIDISQGEIQVTSIQPNEYSKQGVGKTGPAHSFPPLLFSNLSIYLSVLRFNLTYSCTVSEHSWLSCPNEKFKLRKHLANCMFLLNSGVGIDWAGPFFPPPPPPPLGSYLSIYLSVLSFNYSYTESEHSWLTYLKEKFKLQAFSQMILLNRGWGKTGPAHSFPPLLFSNLSIYLSVFRFNLLLQCIWTLMIVLS